MRTLDAALQSRDSDMTRVLLNLEGLLCGNAEGAKKALSLGLGSSLSQVLLDGHDALAAAKALSLAAPDDEEVLHDAATRTIPLMLHKQDASLVVDGLGVLEQVVRRHPDWRPRVHARGSKAVACLAQLARSALLHDGEVPEVAEAVLGLLQAVSARCKQWELLLLFEEQGLVELVQDFILPLYDDPYVTQPAADFLGCVEKEQEVDVLFFEKRQEEIKEEEPCLSLADRDAGKVASEVMALCDTHFQNKTLTLSEVKTALPGVPALYGPFVTWLSDSRVFSGADADKSATITAEELVAVVEKFQRLERDQRELENQKKKEIKNNLRLIAISKLLSLRQRKGRLS